MHDGGAGAEAGRARRTAEQLPLGGIFEAQPERFTRLAFIGHVVAPHAAPEEEPAESRALRIVAIERIQAREVRALEREVRRADAPRAEPAPAPALQTPKMRYRFGINAFRAKSLAPRVAWPMHAWDREYVYDAFAREAAAVRAPSVLQARCPPVEDGARP